MTDFLVSVSRLSVSTAESRWLTLFYTAQCARLGGTTTRVGERIASHGANRE